ncbi:hypothetical protein [Komagataeibacter europaeus]|uniref:hypothetical protein n=1 Tax=Komagataeibacter europaeus TaxID=33995 RepID=UPI002156CC86|nr:hypothetical protein [Komagataeibacter europaeus]GBQ43074.1 hypothetical protein AA18890_1777 [Komagataeibacter europaeus LMG 18890]
MILGLTQKLNCVTIIYDAITGRLTQLKTPPLTPVEQKHIAEGGRVFIVDEVAGPLWRVLMVKGSTCKVLLKPDGADGYSDRKEAEENARVIAALAEDSPLVRP